MGEEAGGAWGEAWCLPSVSMTGEQETHMGGRDRRKLREALRDRLGKGRQLTELGRADSEVGMEPGASGLPSRAQQRTLILA